jgi:hypothetical protein
VLPLVIVVFCCSPASGNAQNTQYCCSPDPDWHLAIRHWAQGNAGYPNRIGGGPIWLIGQARRINGFSSRARGLIVEAEAAVTNVNARIGWANLRPYDAGIDGYSAELIVAHSLGFRSRFDRDVTYLALQFRIGP